jgi:hypothetical protein
MINVEPERQHTKQCFFARGLGLCHRRFAYAEKSVGIRRVIGRKIGSKNCDSNIDKNKQ